MAQQAGGGILRRIPLRINQRIRGWQNAYGTLDRIQEFRSAMVGQARNYGPFRAFVQTILRFRVDNPNEEEEQEDVLLNVSSIAYLVNGVADVNFVLRAIQLDIEQRIEPYQRESGLVFVGVDALRIVFSSYQPNNAGSYIELPLTISVKKAVVNIKNDDQFCLLYCLAYHRFKAAIGRNPQRVSKYRQYNDLMNQWAGEASFPIDAVSPSFAEVESRFGAPINVYIAEDSGRIVPRRISRHPDMRTIEGQKRACNLLLLTASDNWHYAYIEKMDTLIARGVGKRRHEKIAEESEEIALEEAIAPAAKRVKRVRTNVPKDCEYSSHDEDESSSSDDDRPRFGTVKRRFNCLYCMNAFMTSAKLEEHLEAGCGDETTCSTVRELYPRLDKDGKPPVIEWSEKRAQARVSTIRVYADFESIMYDADGYSEHLSEAGSDSYTRRINVHKPCSAAFYVVAPGTSLDGRYWSFRATMDEQCGDVVAVRLLYALLSVATEAERDIEGFDNLPVFFHNLAGYDGHFITLALGRMKGAARSFRKSVIAKNSETFTSITYGNLRFLDSYSLLGGPGMSLKTCVKNLTNLGTDYSKFRITRAEFSSVTDQSLLFKKGEYPYDYFTTVAKFLETSLPGPESFRSLLDCDIGVADLQARYSTASDAWTKFSCNSLGDYHDMYLKLDVCLLADVFEEHRRLSMEDYGLDPGNGVFVSLPNFSWFAMLKSTKVKLEQLTDPTMYQMIERGKRGGQAIITHRYAKSVPGESCITYLDANNLYGWAMSRPLPISDFRWATEIECENWLAHVDGELGMFLEVDLTYPEHLHDLHRDYPLAPENIDTAKVTLSPLQESWVQEMAGRPPMSDKLCGTLYSKTRYVVHAEVLRFYVKHGLQVTAIHRAVIFRQSAWLAPYIFANTQKRTAATTEAAKSFYKLMNNAVFGKTMENVRDRSDIQLVTERRTLLRSVSKPTYRHAHIFQPDNEDGEFLVGVLHAKLSVTLDKPIYAGVAILDLSKLHMYRFHYEVIKPEYGDRARLLFTDTDSLCYHIQSPSFLSDVLNNPSLMAEMDFSETKAEAANALVPMDRCVLDAVKSLNKKVVGKFKDECGGLSISEFVGLRAKCYSFTVDSETHSKAKGVDKAAMKAYIKHADYLSILHASAKTSVSATFHCFRSEAHQIVTAKVQKRALNKYDDKRYILDDGIATLPHGHKDAHSLP
jgi:hypothetical protein